MLQEYRSEAGSSALPRGEIFHHVRATQACETCKGWSRCETSGHCQTVRGLGLVCSADLAGLSHAALSDGHAPYAVPRQCLPFVFK